MRPTPRLIPIALLLSTLAACGIKGALYLPPPAPNVPGPAPVAAPAPATPISVQNSSKAASSAASTAQSAPKSQP